jgi:hypothetical protein
MFNFFRSVSEPEVSEEQRDYFENQFHWLLENFGKKLPSKNPLTPTPSDFPFAFDGTEAPVKKVLEIICKQMEINPAEIKIDYFSQRVKEIGAGATRFFVKTGNISNEAAGLYWGKGVDNKFQISLTRELLKNPEDLAGTIAHELAHVKLLGGEFLHAKYDKDHEVITEMFCVFCGMGIFRANKAHEISHGHFSWSWSRSGYLRQQSWGYLLALYAYWREEKDPQWTKHLSPSIKKDFKVSLKWLHQTDAGENFISSHWKNHYAMNKSEDINTTGMWLIQSIYGTSSKPELTGKIYLSELILNDYDGKISGTEKNADAIKDEKLEIEGTLRNNTLHLLFHYSFPHKVDENGIILRRSERNPYTITYDGYYSPFLEAFIGEWYIKKSSPEKGEYYTGNGTFEMKRK